jgi:prepilin-type N-terminal cleavage/methylation domain-containing protein
MKRRSFTLIEVLVVLSLTAILLTVLFDFLKEMGFQQQKVIVVKETLKTQQSFRLRFFEHFKAVVFEGGAPKGQEKEKRKYFRTVELDTAKGPLLQFTFNNKVDPHPLFCGVVKAEIFLNLQKEMIFAVHSLKEDGKKREEVLFRNVEALSFQFFDPVKKVWEQAWPQNKESLPSMVKIHFKQDSEMLQFAFFLADNEKIPIGVR